MNIDRTSIENGIEVYLVNVNDQTSWDQTLLSESEQDRFSSYLRHSDQLLFGVGRVILRSLLGSFLSVNPRSIKFSFNEYGKPFVKDIPLFFNVSQTGTKIAIAFSKLGEIGIDIESATREIEFQKIASRFFSTKEVKIFEKVSSTDQPKAFYEIWTRKEAFIKAVGEGLSYPLDSFSVTLGSDPVLESSSDEAWSIIDFDPGPQYVGAVAVKAHHNEVRVRNYPPVN